jgi:transposase
MSREEREELAWRWREMAKSLANRAGEDFSTSSRPPSSDDPTGVKSEAKQTERRRSGRRSFRDGGWEGRQRRQEQDRQAAGNSAGKQPSAKGRWRCQPIVVSAEVEHAPQVCAACRSAFGPERKRRRVSAHNSLELVRADMALQVTATRHSYFALRCSCGHDNVERPRVGLSSSIEGRKRNLAMSERCLVGPMLATFIAALSLRCRLSRRKIQEFLADWLDLELGVATIERCIHEFGLASQPVVEQLIEDARAAKIVHLDETPWCQRGVLLWMWVAVTATMIVYRIGGRRKEELAELIGEGFPGWLVTDGYGAYRDHPHRQRCLAHLIRKALALAEGHYGAGSDFGRDLVRDLRRLIERVHGGVDADALARLTTRIKWNRQCNRCEVEKKVRDLAGEILNDWVAVIAFVCDPNLPPTNNDAERALRHAVIARRIGFGTRTDEGSRFYAAGRSVIDTCRTRGIDPWAYACSLIAAARANLTLPMIPPIAHA